MEQPARTRNEKALSSVATGCRARVVRIDAGHRLAGRLTALGLVPGTPIDVVLANGGPMILSVRGCRLMMGRGMAAKVLVRELSSRRD